MEAGVGALATSGAPTTFRTRGEIRIAMVLIAKAVVVRRRGPLTTA